jgi:hypothetical protein
VHAFYSIASTIHRAIQIPGRVSRVHYTQKHHHKGDTQWTSYSCRSS